VTERDWIKQHRRDPAVRSWLRDHPPPDEWRGTPMQWAFTERPEPSRVLPVVLAGLALFGITRLVNLWTGPIKIQPRPPRPQ
jgi:hypothetical protein